MNIGKKIGRFFYKLDKNKVKYEPIGALIMFLLMPFVCFWTMGFPDGLGLVELLSGFAFPALFVVIGYYLLDDNDERSERLKWNMIRYGIYFVVLLAIFIVCNIVVPFAREQIDPRMFLSKRLWFNFIVLDYWPLPIGDAIWFIESLFIATVIFYFADKLNLMRFYKIIMVVLFVFALLTNDLAGVIGLNIFGYTYLTSDVFNRAIPYMLLGLLLSDNYKLVKKMPFWAYIIMFVVGGGLTVGEYYLLYVTGKLVYGGHMIGYAVMAVAVLGLLVSFDKLHRNPISNRGSSIAGIIYALYSPMYTLLFWFIMIKTPKNVNTYFKYSGIIVYFACLIIGILVAAFLSFREVKDNKGER